MSSTENPEFTADIFALDPQKLAGKAIKGLRVAFAISGAAALILGIVLLLWPTKTLAVVAVFLGINFLIAGAVRVGLGVFSHGLSAGLRILDVFLGLLILVAGVITLERRPPAPGPLCSGCSVSWQASSFWWSPYGRRSGCCW